MLSVFSSSWWTERFFSLVNNNFPKWKLEIFVNKKYSINICIHKIDAQLFKSIDFWIWLVQSTSSEGGASIAFSVFVYPRNYWDSQSQVTKILWPSRLLRKCKNSGSKPLQIQSRIAFNAGRYIFLCLHLEVCFHATVTFHAWKMK